MLVDRNSLDENAERNFCLSHFLGDLSLFGGVDMGKLSMVECKYVNIYLYNHTNNTNK